MRDTNGMKIGRIACTDSFTPRMLRTVSSTIDASSTATFVRCTGSAPRCRCRRPRARAASEPNHARGIMLKMASPPAAIDVVIVST